MEGTSIGTITLDLKIENTIEAQLGQIQSQVTKSAQSKFSGLGNTIVAQMKRAFSKVNEAMRVDTSSVEAAGTKVRSTAKSMSRAYESARLKLSDVNVELTQLQTRMTEIENSTKNNLKDLFPGKDDLYAATEAALNQDKVYQQLGKRMDQLLLKSDQLKARMSSVSSTGGASMGATFSGGASSGSNGTKQTTKSIREATAATQNFERASAGVTSRVGAGFAKLGNAIKGAFKAVFITAGVYAGFRALQSMMQGAMAQNQEFHQSLAQVKANLTAAFQPIFTAITPALSWLMSMLAAATRAIASFINGLFGGISKKAASTTKKIQGVGGAAAGAAKEAGGLASFDKINNLNSSKNGGGGGGGAGGTADAGFEVDPKAFAAGEKFKAMLKSIADTVKKYKDPIIAGLAGIGAAIATAFASKQLSSIGGFKGAFSALGKAVKSAASFFNPAALAIGVLVGALVYLYRTNDEVKAKLDAAWAAIKTIIVSVVQQISTLLVPLLDYIKTILLSIWNDVIQPIALLVVDIISDVVTTFQALWEEYGEATFAKIRECIESLKNLFVSVWENFFKPIFDTLFSVIRQLWTDHLQPFLGKFGEFVAKLVGFALDIYNNVISPIVQWFSETFGPIFSGIFSGAIQIFGDFFGKVVDIIGNLLDALGGIIDFITAVFKGDWGKAWEAVTNVFGNIWSAISDIACGALNAVIWVVNKLIDAYNATIGAVGNFLLGWLGADLKIKHLGYISAPGKNGGYVQDSSRYGRYLKTGLEYIPYDDFPAVLHKGEAVLTAQENRIITRAGGLTTVLSQLKQAPALITRGLTKSEDTGNGGANGLISVINKLLPGGSGNGPTYTGDVVFQINGDTIGRVAVAYILDYIRTHGESPIPVGV